MNEEKVFSTEWLGRTLIIKTGLLAKQANAAVTVQYGDTVVMATVVQSNEERGVDFFPLMVDFEERLYAAGIIKGSRWVKREGRPSDDSVLTGRMVDRAIRPLFDNSSRKDVQVIITVLSVDQVNDHDVVSLIAASAALSMSGLEWNGPIGGVRVGQIENQLVFNPSYEEQEQSRLDLIVSGTEEKVIMIEAGGKEVEDNVFVEAVLAGQRELQPIIKLIKEMQAQVEIKIKEDDEKLLSAEELEAKKEKEAIMAKAEDWLRQNIKPILFDKEYYTKGERKAAVKVIKKNLDKFLFEQGVDEKIRKEAIQALVEKQVEEEVTNSILNEGKRVDGRALDEIRSLSALVGILPRNHGAGLFSRGETQVMSIVTLGASGLEQTIESMEGESKKRYMHHYNFPPYSVGEAKPMRGAGRREIGHGTLAEKALMPIIPSKEEFPYAIRVVSETLGSNGSSSMGATCASTLALMDAGVPIKKHVGGIAMGLASNADMSKWAVLTDIQDLEDGQGGMDFKITGTVDGITAVQLDTKTNGLTEDIIRQTIIQGRKALNQVIGKLSEGIPAHRPDLSQYAPRITSFYIDPAKIREVIGTGGKIINEIIEVCDVSIDIEDDGLVMVCGINQEGAEKAVKWIKDIVREIGAGEVFTGKVVRLMDFGAFVQVLPGRDGMVHVSEMAPYRVGRPEDLVKIGDEVAVKVIEIDSQGRVNLSMKTEPANEPLWKDRKGEDNNPSMRPRGVRPGGDRRGGSGGHRSGPRR